MLVTIQTMLHWVGAGVLKIEGDRIARSKGPPIAWLRSPIHVSLDISGGIFFHRKHRLRSPTLMREQSKFNVCFWSEAETEKALTLMAETGNISIDRQMRPWIIERRRTSAEVWPTAWSGLA